MRERGKQHVLMTLLLLCAVLSAFYLRSEADRPGTSIPVQQVFLRAAATEAPDFRQQRQTQRAEELAALSALAQQDAGLNEQLQRLVERAEAELAVESALAAMGYPQAACALREDAAAVCLPEKLDAARAQAVIELCARLTGLPAENVFILDGNAHL